MFNGKRGEKIQFRAKIGSGYTGGCSRELFQISFLTWTSKIQKIKLQTKELNKMADMADEELEKSIDDQESVNTCRSTTPD